MMTAPEIATYRLASQQLTGTELVSAVEMLEWFGAIQGQEYAQTKWSIGLRLHHLGDDDIERELTAGSILRTHLLRPTWHFVSAADIRWLLILTAPRVHMANAYMYRQMELDSAIFNRCNDILIRSLQGCRQLTRDELNEAFAGQGIIARGHRLSYIMMNAELEGILCSGARRGNQFTYALLEERAGPAPPIGREEALGRLTERYFASRGPANVRDFATWSGLTLTDCRTGIGIAGSRLHKAIVNDAEYWFQADMKPAGLLSDTIHLLPVYDELIMGYKDRSAFFYRKNDLHPGVPLRHDAMIVSGGQVIGTWRRTIRPRHIDLQYEFFQPLNDRQQAAFAKAVHRLEDFSGLKVNP